MRRILSAQFFAIALMAMVIAFATAAKAESAAAFGGASSGDVTSVDATTLDDAMSGDAELACEASLCLSSSTPPPECQSIIDSYNLIQKNNPTVDFLSHCQKTDEKPDDTKVNIEPPVDNPDPAEACNAETLNATLTTQSSAGSTYISDQLPDSCANVENPPIYACSLDQKGGHWVEVAEYTANPEQYTDCNQVQDENKDEKSQTCDARSLNSSLLVTPSSGSSTYFIGDKLPDNCAGSKNPPKYVGTPDQGGYWVEADNYDSAQNKYYADHCNAHALNSSLTNSGINYGSQTSIVGNRLPDYCTGMSDPPRYVGEPGQGGYWVEANNYDSALAEYEAAGSEEAAGSGEEATPTVQASGQVSPQNAPVYVGVPSQSGSGYSALPSASGSGSTQGSSRNSAFSQSDETEQESGIDANSCDARSLNTILLTSESYNDDDTYISDKLPYHCLDIDNPPRYIGTPKQGGHWVNAKDYEKAQADYKARI